MPVGKNKGGKHEITDPRKKLASTANTERGQQLSDKNIQAVAKGRKTYEQAMKEDRARDAKVKTITKVGKETRGSSQGLASKRKYTKATHSINKSGNMEAN